MELLRNTLFILAFCIISNGLFGQIYWNELKDADTIGYVLVSKIDGTFDTMHISDFYPHFKVQGTVPLNGNKAGDYLFNTLTGDISVWDGDSTFAGTWRTIWDASAVADAGSQTLTIDSTGRTFTIGITDGNEVKFQDTNLSEEQVQDYVGTMVTGNTETGIAVTYDDTGNKINFVATDASATNELQTLTESLDFIDITGSGTAAMTITSLKDRPKYSTYLHTEGETLRPWWSDAEDSWYLADERFLSVSNTCGLNNSYLFNMGDNFGNVITDSCTINIIITDQSNAVAYPDGYMYFVPYASQLTMGSDSVKIRTRDKDNVWTTPVPKQAVNIVDAPSDYGWIYLDGPVYTHEVEITYYTASFEISELEYFYIRGNGDIPMVRKNSDNTFYYDNTFLGGLGDQYLSFGTTGQLLSSDGTGIEWIDPYEFDSTGIYDYVDANIYDTTYLYDYITTNDLWNKSTDTVINEPDWNRLQLDEYGKGMYNNYGKAVATINYNGTFNSMPIESFDIDRTNEHRLEDNYIEDESFNYINFIKKNDGSYFFNPPFINSTNVQLLQNKTSLTTASDFYITDSLIYSCANKDLSVYDWDGVSLSSITLRHFYDNLLLYQDYSLQVTDEELIFLYYSAGSLRKANKSDIDNGTWTGVLESLGDVSSSTDLLDFGINNDKWFIQDSDNHIKVYQFNDWLDFVNSTLLFTINLPPTALGFNSTSSYYKDDYIIYSSYNSDSLYIFDASNGDLIHSTNFPDNMVHINEYNDIIYSGFLSNLASYVFIARDTSFTTLPEKLDTSNYYSYSIEIEGNNVDTVRTGIATWLDGNVSYNWCSGDTLYTGWHRFDLDFKAAEHDSIKPVFVIADTTSIKNVRLFLKQYQNDAFDDTAIQERIDSVITIFVTHDTNDADTVIGNEYNTTLTLAGTELQLTDGGGTLTQELSSFLDNTDTQGFDVATFTGGLLSLSIDNDGDATHEFDFDARYLQSEVDGSVTNEGVLSMNTDLANVTFSVNSNSSGSVPMYFTEETAVSGDNRAVDLERTGNAITFNLKDADELETVTISAAADYFLVWDATDSDWKVTTISNIPGDGTGTDDQTLSIVSAAAGTISIESGNTIDLTSLVQLNEADGSTTNELQSWAIVDTDAGTISLTSNSNLDLTELVFDQVKAFFTGNTETGITVTPQDGDNTVDFVVTGGTDDQNLSFGTKTTINIPLDIESGIGVTFREGSNITLDRTASNIMTINATDYYISDAFMSGDNLLFDMPAPLSNFSVDLSQFYDNTDDQQQVVNFLTYYRLGNESQSGTGISIIPGTGISITGTTGSSGSITISATGGADGNGLWDSGNNNSLMAAGITGYVNNYMAFYNATGTGSPILWVDDATTDYVAVGTSTQSNSAIFNVGGIVDIAGNTWIDGFLTLGTLSGTPTALLGKTSGGIVTDDLVLGDALVLSSGNLDVAIPWGRMSRSSSQTSSFAEVIPSSQTINDADVFTVTGNRIEVDQAGDYEITISGWLSASGDGYYPQLLVRKNGSTTLFNTVAYIETSASDKFSVHASDIVTLSALDEISMYISEISSAGNVTVEEARMTIKKISD